MPLQFDPTLSYGTSGNVLANTTLKNNPTAPSSTSFLVDCSTALGCYLQVWCIATGLGPVSTNSGTLVNVYSSPDNVWYDTSPYGVSANILSISTAIARQSFVLDTGKYNVVLTNTDPFNNINVMATTGLLS